MRSPIAFHNEDRTFRPRHPERLKHWMLQVIRREGRELAHINVIFCSDRYLNDINVRYLGHDTYTDIISFPYGEPPQVEGDIFISLDRVRENAQAFGVPWLVELQRVLIHGVLHFCGYSDDTPEAKATMRRKEDEALELLGGDTP